MSLFCTLSFPFELRGPFEFVRGEKKCVSLKDQPEIPANKKNNFNREKYTCVEMAATQRTPTPFLLDFTGPWKAIARPPSFGVSTPALADFDACKKALGTSDKKQELLNRMLYNKVRVCGACKKPNGFTLSNCNACGHDIGSTDVTNTLNVFSGFMLSIAKSTFPLTVSLRLETKSMIVIDDLLALSPAHVNVVPTRDFIPDWRFLLRKPKEGLELAKSLKAHAVEAMNKNYLQDEAFLSQFTSVNPASNPFNAEADLSCGFNFPPSQNQLHLQCIFPVVLPYQYYLYEKNMHFTPGRFFPYEYVVQALTLAVERPLCNDLLQEETPIEAIVDHFTKVHSLDAEALRMAFVRRFEDNYKKFQRWDRTRFHVVAKPSDDGKSLVASKNADCGGTSSASDEAVPVDVMALVGKDKTVLQCYGRPYTTDGKPAGNFYQFPATDVEQITFW